MYVGREIMDILFVYLTQCQVTKIIKMLGSFRYDAHGDENQKYLFLPKAYSGCTNLVG